MQSGSTPSSERSRIRSASCFEPERCVRRSCGKRARVHRRNWGKLAIRRTASPLMGRRPYVDCSEAFRTLSLSINQNKSLFSEHLCEAPLQTSSRWTSLPHTLFLSLAILPMNFFRCALPSQFLHRPSCFYLPLSLRKLDDYEHMTGSARVDEEQLAILGSWIAFRVAPKRGR